MRSSGKVLRTSRITAVVLAFAALLFVPTGAAYSEVLLSRPIADDSLRELRAGYSYWLSGQLESAGLSPTPAPSPVDGHVAPLLEQARSQQISYVIVPDMRLGEGTVRVGLRLFASDAGGLVASSMARVQVDAIGDACGDADGALEAFETVRRLDPTRNSVEERIETLRAETQRTRMGDAPLTSPPVMGATTGGAPAESRYEILGELGRGGMGVVYRARDTRLNRIVALKQLPDNLRDNAVAAQLFLREAQAAASLNHRNIVTVYDAGEENGVYHITMELLEGLPLSAIQERRGTLGVGDTAGLGLQVCAGLDYAHTQRIVHRDIKTANLFFTRDRVVKIMDFGLAKTIEEVRKNSTVIGGTPYYMAPEQAAGEPVDNRTDLYAFGITLYRLLTGTFPFTDGSVEYHHRHTPPPDPREHVAEICEDMARLVLDLLEKDPELRPATAADVAARLQAIRQEATKSA